MSSPSLSPASPVEKSYETPSQRPPAWPFLIPALVFLGALLFGCATPSPVYRLEPLSNDVTWVNGRAALQQERGGIRVATSFEHQDGDRLEVRIEIQNGSDQRIEIGPQQIWYSACSGTAVATCASSVRVVDPERVLAALDEKESRDTAAAANSQAALGALVLLSAVADVATIASGKADSSTGLLTATSASVAASAAAQSDSELASISYQRQMWSNQALRRNTLFPGQGTSGDVFLPIYPSAGYVWVQLRAGGQTFAFHFEQRIISVDRYGHRSQTSLARR
jgi:hypothetical protein